MRGRLSINDMVGVEGVVPGLNRERITPSLAHPIRPIIKTIGRARPIMPRRWHGRLGEDFDLIKPRVVEDFAPLLPPPQIRTMNAPASNDGFWSNIAGGLSKAVSGILPAFAQVKTAQLMTSAQSDLLRSQGSMLYTPANIQTLQNQAAFEASQRQIEQGRQLGTTAIPLSATTLALIGGAGLVLYLVMKQK